MSMSEELMKAWEESKKDTTPELRKIFKDLAKHGFNKYNDDGRFKYEYWVESYIIEGMLKHRNKYNPDKGTIRSHFSSLAASLGAGIIHKLIMDELLSSES